MMNRAPDGRGIVATLASKQSASLASFIRSVLARVDRPGWRKFFSALVALGLGFLLAIYSNIFAAQGRVIATGVCASLALLLSGYVALTAVPYLARRASLEWLRVSIEYELTREGIFFIGVVFLLAIAGLNTGNNLLYLVVASLLASILMSGVMSLGVLSGLSLEILLPEHVFARRRVPARIHLENQKRFLPSFSIALSGSGEGDKGRDRKSKSRAAAKHSAISLRPRSGPAAQAAPQSSGQNGGILRQALYFPFVPAAHTISRQVELEFPRRGLYREKGFTLSTRFPFGFLEKKLQIEVSRQLLVYPAVEPTEEFYEILPLLSGELEAFQRGRGHDLYSIRDMLPTDSARHVDWKASARSGEVKVREFMREDERRLQLVLDRRIGEPDDLARRRFEAGVEFCACLAWHFYELDAQLQFLCDDFQTPAARTGDVIYDILGFLAGVEPSSESPLETLAVPGTENIFRIVLTGAPRGSIPTASWSRSYIIFFDALWRQPAAGWASRSSPGDPNRDPASSVPFRAT
jgi:uncharacterized protein (DUF58 family)